MKLFYGSFGIGQKLGDYIQPIKAKNRVEAQNKMLKEHGKEWCEIYSEIEIKNLDEYKKLEVI